MIDFDNVESYEQDGNVFPSLVVLPYFKFKQLQNKIINLEISSIRFYTTATHSPDGNTSRYINTYNIYCIKIIYNSEIHIFM